MKSVKSGRLYGHLMRCVQSVSPVLSTILRSSASILVNAFGGYHVLFWNEAAFMRILLKVICDGPCDLSLFITTDPRHLVHFLPTTINVQPIPCFIVSSEETKIIANIQHPAMTRLLQASRQPDTKLSEGEVETASQIGIDFLCEQAFAEPRRQMALDATKGPSISVMINDNTTDFFTFLRSCMTIPYRMLVESLSLMVRFIVR